MGEFLERNIQSVLNQDYQNIEHLIEDGASTDNTTAILQKYDEKLDWQSKPDKGQADALNNLLKRCNGDLLLVLNADDELLPQACSWAVKQFARYPDQAVIYGDQFNVDEQDRVISKTLGPDPYNFAAMLCVESVLPAQAAFIRRDCLETVGLGTDYDLATCPDYEMWLRLGARYSMLHIPGMVCRYRWHGGSEGQQPNTILTMVITKRQILNKFLADPSTPVQLKTLRKRAQLGIVVWGLDVLSNRRLTFQLFSIYLRYTLLEPLLIWGILRHMAWIIIRHYSIHAFYASWRFFDRWWWRFRHLLVFLYLAPKRSYSWFLDATYSRRQRWGLTMKQLRARHSKNE